MNATLTVPLATEADALARNESGTLCELLDGRLVGKTLGSPESYLAARLATFLNNYLATHDLGFIYGPDALIRFAPGLLLEPDASFTAWRRVPGGVVPIDPIAGVAPNLVVEILSPSNRPGELARQLAAYFAAGVELVWVVDPATRSAVVHTAPDAATPIAEADSLDGGGVLPGFALKLATLFARLGR